MQHSWHSWSLSGFPTLEEGLLSSAEASGAAASPLGEFTEIAAQFGFYCLSAVGSEVLGSEVWGVRFGGGVWCGFVIKAPLKVRGRVCLPSLDLLTVSRFLLSQEKFGSCLPVELGINLIYS